MTQAEFNKKYEKYLEAPGYPGLCFDNKEFTSYLDKKFKKFIKIPNFTWAQVKQKFSQGRFYCTNVPFSEVEEIEQKITEIK